MAMWGYGPYVMGGGWGMGPMMFFGGLFWVFLLVLIAIIVMKFAQGPWQKGEAQHRRSAGLAILDERYAKGELQREEYLQKKSDLGF